MQEPHGRGEEKGLGERLLHHALSLPFTLKACGLLKFQHLKSPLQNKLSSPNYKAIKQQTLVEILRKPHLSP